MFIEQPYNVDIKQKQGFCGITLKPKAQTKWLYTAAVAGAFRKMLLIILHTNLKQHKAGLTAILRVIEILCSRVLNIFLFI